MINFRDMEEHSHDTEVGNGPVMNGDGRRSPRRSGLGLIPFIGATAAVALVGSAVTRRGRGTWYRLLRKPRYNPPAWMFGPVWTTLYGLMSWSAYRIWKQPDSPERTRALQIWGTGSDAP